MIGSFENEEKDLILFIRPVYIHRITILKITLFCFLLGVIITISIPNRYTAKTIFIPQTGSSSNDGESGISGLASLAGFNLGMPADGASNIPPTLYPKIVNSTPFKTEILNFKLLYMTDSVSVRDYILGQSSSSKLRTVFNHIITFPSRLVYIFGNSSTQNESSQYETSPSIEDIELFKHIENNLSLIPNNKEGFVTFEYTDKDRFVSSQIVQKATLVLQSKIIEFKNQTAREELEFTKAQYNDNKKAFERIQDSIAIFRDQNLNISNSFYQNKLNRLEFELEILSSVTEQLANKVEQAKLKVTKDTPVFTIIEPVTLPTEKSSPRRSLIVIIMTSFSAFFSCSFYILKRPIRDFIRLLKNENI